MKSLTSREVQEEVEEFLIKGSPCKTKVAEVSLNRDDLSQLQTGKAALASCPSFPVKGLTS